VAFLGTCVSFADRAGLMMNREADKLAVLEQNPPSRFIISPALPAVLFTHLSVAG
jgi:hypothetical protein